MFSLGVMSLKPKNIQTLFEIRTLQGCKWTYRCDFNFIVPPPDDSLEIIAPVHKMSSVKFRLNNFAKCHAKFNAYFTSDSCVDFSVKPQVGELEPYGRDGTPI